MKIVEKLIRHLEISEVQNLDPIRVTMEDIEPRKGRINIECYGKAWASYWGAMGDRTIAEFFCSCDEHYLAKNLASGLNSSVFDPEGLIVTLRKEVIRDRRRHDLTASEARELFDEIDEVGDVSDPWSQSSLMQKLLGDEWWYRLPEKDNPDYLYLTRIIRAVKEALFSTMRIEEKEEHGLSQ